MSMWRLVVFDVPDRLGGLMSRLKFKQTKRTPRNWPRIFYPERGRAAAEKVMAQLRSCDLRMKWYEVTDDARIDLRVVKTETAKELRLAQEALKRAQEARRQAERRAENQVYERAHAAVRKARGGRPGDYPRRREPPAP